MLSVQEACCWMSRMGQGRPTLYEFFPGIEYKELKISRPADLLRVYGEQYRAYLSQSLWSEKIRNACHLAAQCVPHSPQIRKWAEDLAALSMMGCIRVKEFTTALLFNAFAVECPVVEVILGDGADEWSYVLLINGDMQQITAAFQKNEDVESLMQKLTGCVIIDPYLQSAVTAENFGNSKTMKHLLATDLKTVLDMVYLAPKPNPMKQVTMLYQLSETIRERASAILNEPSNTNERIQELERLLYGVPMVRNPSLVHS